MRGQKKHLKRLAAPTQWCVGKFGGAFVGKPQGPIYHLTECIPVYLLIQRISAEKLDFALIKKILQQEQVEINGVIRKEPRFAVGFTDIVTIYNPSKTQKKHYRVLFSESGKFKLVSVRESETQTKLCKVKLIKVRKNKEVRLHTTDGRCYRFPPVEAEVGDTVLISTGKESKILRILKPEVGSMVYVYNGKRQGQAGKIITITDCGSIKKNVVEIKDFRGNLWTTKLSYTAVYGTGEEVYINVMPGLNLKYKEYEKSCQIYGDMKKEGEKGNEANEILNAAIGQIHDMGISEEGKEKRIKYMMDILKSKKEEDADISI